MIALAFALLQPAAAAGPTWAQIQAASWAPVATHVHAVAGEVQVLEAVIEGQTCYRGLLSTDTPAKSMVDTITDWASAVKWSSSGLRESVVLGREGNTIFYYQYLDIPDWTMASDRFWFNRGEILTGADGSTTVTWHLVPGGGKYADVHAKLVAANPGAVEITTNVGGWHIQPKGGSNQVTYSICSNTGGSLPAFAQSAATRQSLPDNLGDMVKEARRRAGL